jgi:hypothetical protein
LKLCGASGNFGVEGASVLEDTFLNEFGEVLVDGVLADLIS